MTDELVSSAARPSRNRRVPMITRNLGHPRGIVGRITGRLMSRGNDCLNEWVVDRLAERHTSGIRRIVEIGPGPGVGLGYLLEAFPAAQVWGIDHSAVMVRQARRSNSDAVRSGRLMVMRGDSDALARHEKLHARSAPETSAEPGVGAPRWPSRSSRWPCRRCSFPSTCAANQEWQRPSFRR